MPPIGKLTLATVFCPPMRHVYSELAERNISTSGALLEMRARLDAALQRTNGGADASALAAMVLVAGGAPPSALAADPPRGGGGPAHGTAGVALVVVVAPQQSSRAQALPTAADEMTLVAVEVRAPPARPTTLDVGRTRSNCGCPHQRCRAKTAVA